MTWMVTPQSSMRRSNLARNLFGTYAASKIGSNAGKYARKKYNEWRSPKGSGSTDPQVYGGSASKPYKKQYKKKRQSKRKRRKAKRHYNSFKKSYRKISGVALQKAMFNGSVNATALPTAQQWLATHLYSYNSSTGSAQETGTRDVYQIMNTLVNPTMADDIDNSSKRMIETGIIDITLNNIGTTRCEIDAYHITYNNEKDFSNLSSLFTAANATQQSLTGTAADRITMNNRGATLFDLNQFLQLGSINIISKEKMFIGPQEVYNFQYKVKGVKQFTPNKVNQENGHVAEKGLTHSWVFVFKAVTGETANAAIQIASTRSYAYRIDGLNQQATALLPE